MLTSSYVDAIPLWLLFTITALMVLLAIELGWRMGNYRRTHETKDKPVPVGAAVGATLGLLAFLLAFTFGMAATRYDNRKDIVLREANSIGTTFLRTDFLPEPLRSESQQMLRDYAGLRAGGASAILSPQGRETSATLLNRLWSLAALAEEQSDTVSTGLYIQSLNETIDLDGIRVTALRNRIPDTIWIMLGVVTVFSMAALGYDFGLTGNRSWAIIILLAIAYTAVILMIADLDRPQTGLLRISQQPLLDLLEQIGPPAH